MMTVWKKTQKKTFNVYYSKYVTQMIFSWWSNVNHFCSFCLTNLNYLCHLLLNNIENIVKKIIISALFCLSALCSFTWSLCNKHCPSWKSCCCRGVLKWGIKKTWKHALPPRSLFSHLDKSFRAGGGSEQEGLCSTFGRSSGAMIELCFFFCPFFGSFSRERRTQRFAEACGCSTLNKVINSVTFAL